MPAGPRKRLVQIQRATTAQDGIGQPIPTWSKLADTWADIRYLSGLESIKAGADAAIARVSMRCGYRTDITSAMRVVDATTVYTITAVLPDVTGRRHVDLVCEVANG
jgi:SPP1 family predicted phage head-tail adaptor